MGRQRRRGRGIEMQEEGEERASERQRGSAAIQSGHFESKLHAQAEGARRGQKPRAGKTVLRHDTHGGSETEVTVTSKLHAQVWPYSFFLFPRRNDVFD